MSIQTSTSLVQYHGNASTATPYPVPFLFLENSHLKVIVTDGLGVDHPLAPNTDFTVMGAGDSRGGSIRTTFAWPTTHKVTISREVPATQLTSYAENGDFPAASHEQALDKLTMLVQQNGRGKGITLRLPETRENIPELQPRGTTVIGFDGLVNPVTYDSAELVAFLNLKQSVTDSPTKTFADAGARAAAIPEFIGQVGVQVDDKSLWVSDAVTVGAWEPVLSGVSYNNDAYTIVATSTTATANGTALLAAYAAAVALTPGGHALSATNRACVIVPPGVYDLGSAQLVLNTQFVDVIGLTTNRNAQRIISQTATSNAGVIQQTASDVRIENLSLKNNCGSDGSFSASSAADYFCTTNLTGAKLRNVECLSSNGNSGPYPMRLGVTYSGRFEDCHALGSGAFGAGVGGVSVAGIASGTFIRCTGGEYAFGGNDGCALTGTCVDCAGGQYAFGGYHGSIGSTAVLINCRRTAGNFYDYGLVPAAGARLTNCHDNSVVIYFPSYPTGPGGILQTVNAANETYSSYPNNIPLDASVPQIGEGGAVVSASITPTSATSKIRVRFSGCFCSSSDSTVIVAVFKDSVSNAVHAAASRVLNNLLCAVQFEFTHAPAIPSTPVAITYSVRAGLPSGTLKINGVSSRLFGGAAKVTLTLEEIKG